MYHICLFNLQQGCQFLKHGDLPGRNREEHAFHSCQITPSTLSLSLIPEGCHLLETPNQKAEANGRKLQKRIGFLFPRFPFFYSPLAPDYSPAKKSDTRASTVQ
jgi:hypothetical protein